MSKPVSAWYRASGVRRFHTLPTLFHDNVGQHTAGVAFLVNYMLAGLVGDSARLCVVLRALFHDLPEFKTGDIPSPTKAVLDTDALDEMEARYMEDFEISEDLTEPYDLDDAPPEWARAVVSLADAADGMIRAAVECRAGNACFREAYTNYERYLVSRVALVRRELPAGMTSEAIGNRADAILNYARGIYKGEPL